MKIEARILRSGIVRRIVACFVVATLLPLATTVALSLETVRNLLREQSHVRLARAADDYAYALHDRLLAVDRELQELSTRSDLVATRRDGDWGTLKLEFRARRHCRLHQDASRRSSGRSKACRHSMPRRRIG